MIFGLEQASKIALLKYIGLKKCLKNQTNKFNIS